MSLGSLTEKQRKFYAEYEVDHNGTKAAIRAGYATGSAYVTASRLLRKAKEGTEAAKAVAQVHRNIEQRVDQTMAVAGESAAYIITKAIEVVEYCTAMRPILGMFGPIADPETGDPLLEMTDPKGATTALALLAKRHPEFRESSAGADSGAKHLHLHGLGESELRALASGFSNT